ncbi:MAG: pitrilysin family protein [Candidatus Eisenbacteria bacterium]
MSLVCNRRTLRPQPWGVAMLFLLLSALSAWAALPAGVTAGATVEGISEFRLDNGLRVILFPDPSKESITVNATYLVGSRHENYGETGMAHLLEHLMFKGSTHHTNIPDELTAHGARPNGSTSYDRTNYFETFSATDENLDWALDLEADRMVNSFIAKKDLDSEFTVVRNEFERGENDPESILEERVLSTAYLWHNYGHSTIGSRADIENVPIDRLQGFYRNYYQPDNAVLIVAGDFDQEKTLALIAKKFGPIPRPTRELQKLYTVEPAQDGERSVTLKRVGDFQSLCVAYHIPAATHPDFAALEILAFVLGDSPSGRLYKALVEPKLATEVGCGNYQLHDPGVLVAGAQVRKDQSIDAARDAFLATLDQAATQPITETELTRARDSLLKNWDMTIRNSERVGLQLSEWMALGDWRLMFLHRDRLREVAASDVAKVAKAYLAPGNRTVGAYIPTATAERIEIPSAPDVPSLVTNYHGGEALAEGEDFDPTPANIEARVVRTTLPNGLELILLPKKTRGATVSCTMNLHFGDEHSLFGKSTIGDLCGSMLMRGTEQRSRQEIRDQIDQLKARLMVGGSATGAFGSFETTRDQSDGALRLLAELLQQPSFPAAEFDLLKQQQLAGIEQQKSDPNAMAQVAWARHMSPYPKGDVRYSATPEEALAEIPTITLDDVRAFHRDFYGASAGELCLVGDLDPAATTALVTELFGQWKSKQPYARVPNPYVAQAGAKIVIEAPDKENAVFRAGQQVNLSDNDADFPAMTLGNFMTGGGFLNSRLATRLRQKDGLCYNVGSMFFAGAFDQNSTYSARAIYAPQNADRVEQGFTEELTRVLKDGFTADEVSEAKTGWLQGRRMSRGNDGELAGRLASRANEDRTMLWDQALEDRVAALTPEEILTVMRRYLDLSKMLLIRAGDFAKVKAAAGQSAN